MIRTDRRSVLNGLGAMGVTGCSLPKPAQDSPAALPARIEVDLAELEARYGGRIGLEAWDHDRAFWRNGERFLYCSTFKVFLAGAMLQRIARGEDQLDRTVPITPSDMVTYAPVTEAAVGGRLTLERLMQATVEVSDNPAANILIRELGGLDVLRDWYRSIGDPVTRVDRLEPELNRTEGENDTTTPHKGATNIGKLLTWPNPLLGSGHRELLEGWMLASPTGPGRIKAGVPAGYRVAHKTGTSGAGQANDIGLIRPPTGDPILIAVYYDAPGETITPDQRDAVIAETTRLALAALGHGAGA